MSNGFDQMVRDDLRASSGALRHAIESLDTMVTFNFEVVDPDLMPSLVKAARAFREEAGKFAGDMAIMEVMLRITTGQLPRPSEDDEDDPLDHDEG